MKYALRWIMRITLFRLLWRYERRSSIDSKRFWLKWMQHSFFLLIIQTKTVFIALTTLEILHIVKRKENEDKPNYEFIFTADQIWATRQIALKNLMSDNTERRMATNSISKDLSSHFSIGCRASHLLTMGAVVISMEWQLSFCLKNWRCLSHLQSFVHTFWNILK